MVSFSLFTLAPCRSDFFFFSFRRDSFQFSRLFRRVFSCFNAAAVLRDFHSSSSAIADRTVNSRNCLGARRQSEEKVFLFRRALLVASIFRKLINVSLFTPKVALEQLIADDDHERFLRLTAEIGRRNEAEKGKDDGKNK